MIILIVLKLYIQFFQTLNPGDLINEGNTAPIHAGAKKYYLEKGLLKN